MFRDYFLKFWWVIAFALLCGILYEQGLKQRHENFTRLSTHLQSLRKQKEEAIDIQEDLKARINSQNDPAWIELVLIRNLGLIPEGQQKIFMQDSKKIY